MQWSSLQNSFSVESCGFLTTTSSSWSDLMLLLLLLKATLSKALLRSSLLTAAFCLGSGPGREASYTVPWPPSPKTTWKKFVMLWISSSVNFFRTCCSCCSLGLLHMIWGVLGLPNSASELCNFRTCCCCCWSGSWLGSRSCTFLLDNCHQNPVERPTIKMITTLTKLVNKSVPMPVADDLVSCFKTWWGLVVAMRGRVVGYEESSGARLLGGVARCCPPPCTLESIPSMSISSTTTTDHTFNRPTAAMVIFSSTVLLLPNCISSCSSFLDSWCCCCSCCCLLRKHCQSCLKKL